MNKKTVTSILGIISICLVCFNSSLYCKEKQTTTSVLNYQEKTVEASKKEPVDKKITDLKNLAKFYAKDYWNKNNAKNLDIVLEKLDKSTPQNSDYLKGRAFLAISQDNIEKGLNLYKEAFYKNKKDLDPLINRALYAKAKGNTDIYKESKKIIESSGNSKKINTFKNLDLKIDKIKDIKINTEVPKNLPTTKNIFILLGYALNNDGTMQTTLIERLKVAKKALDIYPNAKIIVTGGVEKNGNTESKLMYQWLIENGINKDRIIQENKATDTVENILYSMEIINNENNITNITVISSATHIQRSVSLLNLASEIFSNIKHKPNYTINNIAWLDVSKEELKKSDIFAITRDLLRENGFWLFPSISR